MIKRVYVEITNGCNLACAFCEKGKRSVCELSLDLIEKAFIDGKRLTDYFYLHVKGEPLVHSHFSDVIKLAEKHQIKIQLVTNGTKLKDYYKLLLNSPAIRKISVSLQGLFLSDDLSEKLAVLDLMIKENKDKIIELRVWSSEDPLIKQYLNKYANGVSLDKDCKLANNLYYSQAKTFNWPSLTKPLFQKVANCLGPKLMLCVLSNGVITPCCLDQDGIINLGNIKDISLAEVINKQRYQDIIEGFEDNKAVEDLCQHCDFPKGGRNGKA